MQHGLAQRQPAHQSAQDMLSSRWANASWATALTAHLSQPGAQHASQHTAGKPVADSSRTPLLPGRGNPQNSTPADNAISRPGVATRIPNALFGTAPQIIRAVPRQVSSHAASWLSKAAVPQLSELGRSEHDRASFGSAAQQQPTAGSASLSAPLPPDSRAVTRPVSTALLPGGAAAVSVPLLSNGQAADGESAAHLLSTGKAAAPGPEAVSAPLRPAAKAVAGAASAPLLPTGQPAAAMATPLLSAGKAVTAAATAPHLPAGKAAATALLPPTGKAAKTAPLLPSRKSAVPSFMRPCSKPWGANKGGRAGGLSKTQGVPRGAKGSKGTGAAQREKFAKTSEQACAVPNF